MKPPKITFNKRMMLHRYDRIRKYWFLFFAAVLVMIVYPYQDSFFLFYRPAKLTSQTLPVQKSVHVYMNDQDVPFIKAQTDDDLAFMMGYMQAQLRYPQLEIMRMISKGEISEHVGPVAMDLDHAIRIVDFDRAAKDMMHKMSSSTRVWVQEYLRGLNYWISHQAKLPLELTLLNIQQQPWEVIDLLRIFRLASVDVHGMYVLRFLSMMSEAKVWDTLWNLHMDKAASSIPSFQAPLLPIDYTLMVPKTGSNSVVLSKDRSKNGAGLIASDPHVGVFLPSIWMVMGLHSPSYKAVGIAIPGVPLLALGRNKHIAWGGTNMYGASSYFFEVDDDTPIQKRKTFIKNRWGQGEWKTIRDTAYGPIITDSDAIEAPVTLAMHWTGHQEADEIGAMLSVMRAQNFLDFRQSFGDYAVSAMNFLYTDVWGNIGHVLGYRQPMPNITEKKPYYSSADFDPTFKRPTELPYAYNPSKGYIVSANNRPIEMETDIGWFFPSPERYQRLSSIIEDKNVLDVEDAKLMQQDTLDISALALIDWVERNVDIQDPTWQKIASWNGRYDKDRTEPFLFEMFYQDLSITILKDQLVDPKLINTWKNSTHLKRWVIEQLQTMDHETVTTMIQQSVALLARIPLRTWGEYHVVEVEHIFGAVPILGKPFRYGVSASSGGTQTVYKRAFSLESTGSVKYGANARHISDMSDDDLNYFILFGGQSGFAFDRHNTSMIELWERGEYVHVPLRPQTIEKTFGRHFQFIPEK